MLSITLILLGEPEAAILKAEKALRLSPCGAAVPVAYTILSQGHLLLGHLQQAIELARKACASNPRLYFTHMLLAAALGVKGDLEEARADQNQTRVQLTGAIARIYYLGESPLLGATREDD